MDDDVMRRKAAAKDPETVPIDLLYFFINNVNWKMDTWDVRVLVGRVV